jgi:hypothetical protein
MVTEVVATTTLELESDTRPETSRPPNRKKKACHKSYLMHFYPIWHILFIFLSLHFALRLCIIDPKLCTKITCFLLLFKGQSNEKVDELRPWDAIL